ncbi:MAG: hypothetical protein C4313_00660 [Thermoflexus sp.]|uniref:sialidase family protein n=1 Tax=Thermoflexus sp. TaxID=1969742 RepID=UPI003329DC37
MSRRILGMGLVLLWSLAASLPAATAQGVVVRWERPIRLGEPFAWFPDVVADDAGRVVVVWAGGVRRGPDRYDALMLRFGVNGRWSDPVDIYAGRIEEGRSYAVRNAIALDGFGDLVLTYKHPDAVYFTRAPIARPNAALSWAPPWRLSNTPAYYTELLVDAEGNLHVAWTALVPMDPQQPDLPCNGCSDVFYRQSWDNGQTWSPIVNLSRSPWGSMKPFLWASERERWLYAVWQEGYDTWAGRGSPVGVGLARSADRGRTWEAPRLITATVGTPQQPVIGEDGKGQLLLIWRTVEDDRLYFQRSSDHGATWSAPQSIPGFRTRPWRHPPFDAYDLAADRAGRLHLVAVGAISEETVGLFHLMWDGDRWLGPDLVWADGQFPEWPRLAVSEGRRLHLVWFERDPPHLFDSDAGQYTVWYTTGLTDAPPVTRIPRPRPPSPVPGRDTALPHPYPSPEPTPTLPVIPTAPAELPVEQPKPDREALGLLMILAFAIAGLTGLGWWAARRLSR